MVKIPKRWYYRERGPFFQVMAEGHGKYFGAVKDNEELAKFEFSDMLSYGLNFMWVGGIYVPENLCAIQIVHPISVPKKRKMFTAIKAEGVKASLEEVVRFAKICGFKAVKKDDLDYIAKGKNILDMLEPHIEEYGEEEVIDIAAKALKKLHKNFRDMESWYDTITQQFGFRSKGQ